MKVKPCPSQSRRAQSASVYDGVDNVNMLDDDFGMMNGLGAMEQSAELKKRLAKQEKSASLPSNERETQVIRDFNFRQVQPFSVGLQSGTPGYTAQMYRTANPPNLSEIKVPIYVKCYLDKDLRRSKLVGDE